MHLYHLIMNNGKASWTSRMGTILLWFPCRFILLRHNLHSELHWTNKNKHQYILMNFTTLVDEYLCLVCFPISDQPCPLSSRDSMLITIQMGSICNALSSRQLWLVIFAFKDRLKIFPFFACRSQDPGLERIINVEECLSKLPSIAYVILQYSYQLCKWSIYLP